MQVAPMNIAAVGLCVDELEMHGGLGTVVHSAGLGLRAESRSNGCKSGGA